MSNTSRGSVNLFVDSFDIPWSCGSGTALEELAQFGAYSTARMSGTYNPGYEVTPTFYLIGPDGRVLWHDEQARPLHRKNSLDLVQDLDAKIEFFLQDKPS